MERNQALRELVEAWPKIKAMLDDYLPRLEARNAPYRPYNKIFSVRLNLALIEQVKAIAEARGQSYSEIVTEALAEFVRRESGR
jgi:predicted HicB family RNase H-like nuclease